jgi:hypothetical protein
VAQGKIRYRCFLPDLTGFTAPPCTGPNYQQSISKMVQGFSTKGRLQRCKRVIKVKGEFYLLRAIPDGIRPRFRLQEFIRRVRKLNFLAQMIHIDAEIKRSGETENYQNEVGQIPCGNDPKV